MKIIARIKDQRAVDASEKGQGVLLWRYSVATDGADFTHVPLMRSPIFHRGPSSSIGSEAVATSSVPMLVL